MYRFRSRTQRLAGFRQRRRSTHMPIQTMTGLAEASVSNLLGHHHIHLIKISCDNRNKAPVARRRPMRCQALPQLPGESP
jgi:hypothetical protein